MNKNKKYILIALLASLLFTVTIGFSVWIILSEQASSEHGFILPKREPTVVSAAEVNGAQAIYAGETPELTVTYQYTLNGRTWNVPCNVTVSNTLNTVYTTQPTSATTAGKANVTVTLTPKSWAGKLLFQEWSVPASISILPVAQFNSYYTTVDAALSAAKSATSGTVYAIPSSYAIESGRAASAKTIRNPVTIPSGVKFAIPYSGTPTDLPDANGYFAETKSVINAYNDETKCTNIVTLSNTMTVNGSLCVYGSCISGQGGHFAGNVHGNYGQLIFDKNSETASITVNNGGKAYIYGFVESHETEHSKFVFKSGSQLRIPFTIYEWRGGSITGEISGEIAPFLRFALASIVGTYRVESGASVTGKTAVSVTIITQNRYSAEVDLISSSGSPFLKLPTSGGYIDIAYSSTPMDTKYGKTTWRVYGGGGTITMNPIDVSVSMYSISTKGKYLPVSYLLAIEIYNGTYTLSGQNIKILPGASVTIGEGATATANEVILYSQIPFIGNSLTSPTAYPTTLSESQLNIVNGGKLIINGGIAGKIPAVGAGGTLEIASGAKVTLTSKEFETKGQDLLSYTENLSLPKQSDASDNYTVAGTYYTAPREDGTFGWHTPSFTVTVDTNIGDSAPQTETVNLSTPGGHIIPDPGLDYPYHTLIGWYRMEGDAPADTDPQVTLPLTVYDDTTVYAKWEENQYQINYYVVTDGEMGNVKGTIGGTNYTFTIPDDAAAQVEITLPEITPPATGDYKLQWSLYPDQKTEGFNSVTSYLVADAEKNADGIFEVTIYAHWTGATYNVTFAVLGDNVYGFTASQASGVAAGYYPETVIPSDILAHDNDKLKQYRFEGWFVENAEGGYDAYTKGTSKLSTYATDDGAVTLLAKWVEKEYKVTFNVDGGQAVGPYWINSGSVALPTNSRKGFAFLGWYDAASDGNKVDDAYTPSADVTLYARWQGYTVTYMDGETTISSARYNGTALTLPTPTKEGYKFLGWYTEKAGGGTQITTSIVPETNMTLYAHWAIEHEVTYNVNGGVSVDPETATVIEGNTLTLPTPVAQAGYRFTGWYTATTGGVLAGEGGDSYEPTADVTLYARWEKIAYTITISKKENATVTVDKTTAYVGDTVSVTVSFSESNDRTLTVKDASGNTLLSKNADGTYTFTMPASNVTIEASSAWCLAEGTLITLADGTQKKVEDITADDLLLTFNHETGEFELRNLIYVHHMGEVAANHQVLNLRFSNGEILRIVASHGLFDLTLNDYVYISISNVDQYIGHEFFAVDYDGVNIKNEHIVLEEAYVTEEIVKVYSPVSVYNLNCFASGFLTLTTTSGNQSALFDIFDFDEDMKFDMEKKAEEIERYGLYSYEDFADHYTKEEFDYLLNYIESQSQFFKITLAKGRVAKEDIIKLFDFVLNS